MTVLYSRDDINFTYTNVEDLLADMAADDEFTRFDKSVYYSSYSRSAEAGDALRVGQLFDDWDNNIWDLVDFPQELFQDVSFHAAVELRELITDWMNRHIDFSQVQLLDGNSVEHEITEEQKGAYSE